MIFFNKNANFENTAHLIEQSPVYIIERVFQLEQCVNIFYQAALRKDNICFVFVFFLNQNAKL